MNGKVDICNRALNILGLGTINSLSDKSAEAEACSLIYDSELREAIATGTWSFATKVLGLAMSATEIPLPLAYKYKYVYKKPSDLLKIRKLYPECAKYKVMADLIYSDVADLYLEYIAYPDDEMIANADEFFFDYFAYQLAHVLSYKLTLDKQLTFDLERRAANKLSTIIRSEQTNNSESTLKLTRMQEIVRRV